jgi:hypothetical protein
MVACALLWHIPSFIHYVVSLLHIEMNLHRRTAHGRAGGFTAKPETCNENGGIIVLRAIPEVAVLASLN